MSTATSATAAIFDLDGVLVDTAPLHLQGWKRTALSLGFELPAHIGPRLKGVARHAALDIVLAAGGISADDATRDRLAAEKNDWYMSRLDSLGPDALLPGARSALQRLQAASVPIALASASRNASTVLARTGIADAFDAIVDGSHGLPPKPDPAIFQAAAAALGRSPAQCVVFEDAQAGIAAAAAAGCTTVGIGPDADGADRSYPSLADVPLETIFDLAPPPATHRPGAE